MSQLIIIRKASGVSIPQVSKARISEISDKLATARVRRPSLEDWILSGSFKKLPEINTSVLGAILVANEPMRTMELLELGWVIPSDSLGRTGRADMSVAESIRLWIKQRIGSNIVPMDSLAIAVGEAI